MPQDPCLELGTLVRARRVRFGGFDGPVFPVALHQDVVRLRDMIEHADEREDQAEQSALQ
jgi:hypothetical protein